MNVHLGTAFDEFVAGLLKSGYYQTQSEVLREGLRLLKEREDLKQMRLAEVRTCLLPPTDAPDRGGARRSPADPPGARRRRRPLRAPRASGPPNLNRARSLGLKSGDIGLIL